MSWTMMIGVVVVVVGFMRWLLKTAPRNPSPRRWNEKKCSARENELELKSKPLKTGLKYAVVGVGQVGRRILEALCFRGERDTIAFDAFDNDWLRSSDLDFTFVKGELFFFCLKFTSLTQYFKQKQVIFEILKL